MAAAGSIEQGSCYDILLPRIQLGSQPLYHPRAPPFSSILVQPTRQSQKPAYRKLSEFAAGQRPSVHPRPQPPTRILSQSPTRPPSHLHARNFRIFFSISGIRTKGNLSGYALGFDGCDNRVSTKIFLKAQKPGVCRIRFENLFPAQWSTLGIRLCN